MKLYLSLLVWNVVLVMAMLAEWMDPFARAASIMIAVVAIGGIAVRDYQKQPAIAPAHKKEKVYA